MYERFTDRARKVMQLANQEAQRFNHEYIGTEHVLLGLIKEGSGVAANVLKNLDVDLRKIRAIMKRGKLYFAPDELAKIKRLRKTVPDSAKSAENVPVAPPKPVTPRPAPPPRRPPPNRRIGPQS